MRDSLKWIVTIFFVISFVFGIVGCKEPDTSVNYGSIKGKVLYSNENVYNHSDIQITLVSTDGLMTTEYSSSRGIATNSRSVKDIKTTDKYGEYSFENIPVGVYTIYASSNSSLEKAVTTNIVVKENQTVTASDLQLTATGSIKGCIVIDGSTNGTLGLDVFIAGTSFDGKVGIDGSFELIGIPAKTGYVLCVQKGTSTKIISENLEVKANVSRNIGETYLSSDDFETGAFNWRGQWDYFPENPKKYDAFFYTQDGCSYIWDGFGWGLLAQAGADGEIIHWRGSFATPNEIPDLQLYDAYYNTSYGYSFIFTEHGWQTLAQRGRDGKDGKGINWLGEFSDAEFISFPVELDAYYNTTDGCSYIYVSGSWNLLALGGKGINWRGYYSSYDQISEPQSLDAYYNTTDGCSYIYNGWTWELLAHDGADGADGKGIYWLGSYENASYISDPQYLDAYYNTTDGCSYIYNGWNWVLLAHDGTDGADGKGINWRGSHESASYISDPQYLDAYYDTSDGCSYIYTANGWTLFAKAGADGADGADGKNIVWRGNYEDANLIENPQELDVYFNTTDGCSYIYTNNDWELLAQAGEDGKDGTDGTNGTNGKDGKGINWRGSYSTVNYISSPKYLDAYWNTTENCAYVYNGSKWTVLIKGPASGGTGSSSNTNIGSEVGANVVGTTLISWSNPTGVIRIPNGVTDIAEEVFYNKDNITRVIIPSTVVYIGISAFADCNNLTSVEFLGPGLEIISEEAFANCYNLTSVEFLGSGLEIIGEGAFYNCYNLVNITLPNTLKTIGYEAFMYCSKLTTVNIPSSVVSIGEYAYAHCLMLRNLTIGSGLTELKYRTFYDCDALVSVTIPNTVMIISTTTFYHCSYLTELQISGTWNSGNTLTIVDLKDSSSGRTYTRDTY